MKRILGICIGFLLLFVCAVMANAQTAPGTFFRTGDMTVERLRHTATRLLDGRVLITGGLGAAGRKSEIYDPATGIFTPSGNLTQERDYHVAVLLPDGRVLVGGFYNDSVEIYDPATGTFRAAGRMRTPERYLATATLLPTGKVLLTGEKHAELFDPADFTFTPAGPYARDRWYYSATALDDGRVLFVGDFPSQVYDPVRDAFSVVGADLDLFGIEGLDLHTATLLADGKVLVAGGRSAECCRLDQAELFDPASGKFSAASRLVRARWQHAAVRLRDGRVLVAGGESQRCAVLGSTCLLVDPAKSAELFDPASRSFAPAASMVVPRIGARATLLDNGDALVTSGTTAEIYRPAASASSAIATEYYNATLDHYFITADENERSFVDGGAAGPGWTPTRAIFGVAISQRPGWSPVCRFHRSPRLDASGLPLGPGTHFLTIDPRECELVKGDPEWQYERTAFHAVQLSDGACPAPLRVLWRAYNNGYPAKEPNHRYATDRAPLEAMAARGWSVEGPAMCVE